MGFYLSGHPLEDMVEVLRRRRSTLYADALAQAQGGAEAFRMAGVVRRRQERSSAKSGERFERSSPAHGQVVSSFPEATGADVEPIGIRRLEARPIATLSIEAQERHERKERTQRDD